MMTININGDTTHSFSYLSGFLFLILLGDFKAFPAVLLTLMLEHTLFFPPL